MPGSRKSATLRRFKEAVDLAKHTFTSLMRRLSAAGFKREFARQAVLPDWWDDSCAADAALLPEVEIRVARFIGAPLALVRDASAALAAPAYPGAQLRRVRDINRDRLGPAIHAGLQVAAAVVRNWRGAAPPVRLPPIDSTVWRNQIARPKPVVRLADVLADLWGRGIPVVHVEVLPAPSFQGLACIVEGRPVVLLAHDFDEPARLAFFIAHEVAHIVYGDCSPGQPVVDEQDEVSDDHEIERRADGYAIKVLTGGAPIPRVDASGFKALAAEASAIEKAHGVDAATIVWSWAKRGGDYAKATLAVQALYRMKGGKRAIREQFNSHVDLDAASESDRALLRCLFGDPERDAAAP